MSRIATRLRPASIAYCAAQAAPVEVFYRFAGKTMEMVGNNGTGDVSYDASVTARSAASPAITSTNAGLFRNGTNSGGASYADFSQSLDPYNSGQQGSAGGGTYAVRSGDTLQAIAAALYGDGNLWYRIAEANGLTAGVALAEGQSLILPAGVTKIIHNASTFQSFDAAEAMGTLCPPRRSPPRPLSAARLGRYSPPLSPLPPASSLGQCLVTLSAKALTW